MMDWLRGLLHRRSGVPNDQRRVGITVDPDLRVARIRTKRALTRADRALETHRSLWSASDLYKERLDGNHG